MTNKQYWQSIEAYKQDPAVMEAKTREFPEGHLDDSLSIATTRRNFLKLMGLSFSAGAVACTPVPVKKAIPYLNKPEEVTPGLSTWYASTCGACGCACGILIEHRDGRPIKLEGNPDHPFNQGGLCATGQASLFSLYDANRLKGPYKAGSPSTWAQVDQDIAAGLAATQASGATIALLSSSVVSPSLRALIAEFIARYPSARHVTYDAVSASAIRESHRQSLGKALVPSYRFDQARVIVGIGADFLGTWVSPTQYTVQYAKTRKLNDALAMSTHIQFEAGMSLTGANADHRISLNPSECGVLTAWLVLALSAKAHAASPGVSLPQLPVDLPFLQKMVDLLWANRGASVVVSGSNDVAEQLLVNRINELLGNYGRTIDVTHPSLQKQGDDGAAMALLEDMEAGKVGALLLLDSNPVYNFMQGKRFATALSNVPLSVSFARTLDETSALSAYRCPDHHYLEAWGDAEPRVGLYSLQQPGIAPLFDTRAVYESLLTWMGRSETALQYIQNYWQKAVYPLAGGMANFQAFWNTHLQSGVFVSNRAESVGLSAVSPRALAAALGSVVRRHQVADKSRKSGRFELAVYETAGVRDGRFANNPWLQEFPDPVSKVSWSNYVALSARAAEHLGLAQDDVVAVTLEGSDGPALELPVFLQPGQVMGTVSIALGYGRECLQAIRGANAYPFVTYADGSMQYARAGVSLEKTGKRYALASTQTHHSMEGRDIVIETTLAAYKKNPQFIHHPELVSLWDKHPKEGYAWGMSIDLNACTGCSGCVIACQVENNVPVVGEDEVRIKRQLYWLRLDRYYSDTPENPETVFQPMLCQHCGNAPCETVCPVLATTHSSEGLNQQIYNRCVGTRYCANNCPYKVRRFNWFDYAHDDALANLALNPDVAVRSRGVMEKCTMCVQRIQSGKAEAARDHRKLRDGEVKTACEQSCPTGAIVFGDLNDPKSRVSRLVRDPRNYHVLEELGTRPVVSYLAKVRNPLA